MPRDICAKYLFELFATEHIHTHRTLIVEHAIQEEENPGFFFIIGRGGEEERAGLEKLYPI